MCWILSSTHLMYLGVESECEHCKLYQVWVMGLILALNDPFFIEGLMKWSSLMLCSGVGWISELYKGPFGVWWNQNGCYGNHAIANVSENVSDLDWWNLALPQFDYNRRVNTREGWSVDKCWCSFCFIAAMHFSDIFFELLSFLTRSHFSFQIFEHHIEFRSQLAPWLQGPSALISTMAEYFHSSGKSLPHNCRLKCFIQTRICCSQRRESRL